MPADSTCETQPPSGTPDAIAPHEELHPLGPPPRRRVWRRRLLVGLGISLLLCVIAGVWLRLHFNNAWFERRLRALVKQHLGRECRIGRLEVSYLSGSILIEDMSVQNLEGGFGDDDGTYPPKDPKEDPENEPKRDVLRVKRVQARVRVLGALFSGFKEFEALKVEIERPELLVAYKEDPKDIGGKLKSNLDDLLARTGQGPAWPRHTGLQRLSGRVVVTGGVVSRRHPDEGPCRFEDLTLTLNQAALGEAAQVAIAMDVRTPPLEKWNTGKMPEPQLGRMQYDGSLNWIGADGAIDPRDWRDIQLSGPVHGLDLAYLFLLKDWFAPYGDFRIVPGNSFGGTIKFEAPTLSQARLLLELDGDTLAAAYKKDGWYKFAAGKVPGRLNLDARFGWQAGVYAQGSISGGVSLAATREALGEPRARLLELKWDGNPAGQSRVDFNADMGRLLATDLGVALGWDKTFGGKITGTVTGVTKGQVFTADGELKTDGAYVMRDAGPREMSASIRFHAEAQLSSKGIPESAELTARAWGDSFRLNTDEVKFGSLDPANPKVDANLEVKLGGRELRKQFAPILDRLNVTLPNDEELNGRIALRHIEHKTNLKFDGTLVRQGARPEPLQISFTGERAGPDPDDMEKPAPPPSFTLSVKSGAPSAGEALDLQLAGTFSQDKTQRIIELTRLDASAPASAMQALDARFRSHFPLWLPARYKLDAAIQHSGQARITQTLGADGKAVSTETQFSSVLKLPALKFKGPGVFDYAPIMRWEDKDAVLQCTLQAKDGVCSSCVLKLKSAALDVSVQAERVDGAKLLAALAATRLALSAADADAGAGTTETGGTPAGRRETGGTPAVRREDRAKKVAAARAAFAQAWLEALPQAVVEARATPAGVRQLRALVYAGDEDYPDGEAALDLRYHLRTRRASLVASIDGTGSPPAGGGAGAPARLGQALKVEAQDFDAAPVLAQAGALLFARADGQDLSWRQLAKLLPPDASVDAEVSAEAAKKLLAVWGGRAGVPARLEPLAPGRLVLNARYHASKKDGTDAAFHIDMLKYNNALLSLTLAARPLALEALLGLLENDAPGAAGWLAALPTLALEAKLSAQGVRRLQELQAWPPEAAFAGEAAVAGSYDPAAGLLKLDSLSYSGADGSVAALAAPAVDLRKLAAYADAKVGPGGAGVLARLGPLLPLLPDLELKLDGKPALLEALHHRLWPNEPPLRGDIALRARYRCTAGELEVERLAVTATADSQAPLMKLEMLGKVDGLKALAERAGGALRLEDLSHIKTANINRLVLDAARFKDLLRRLKPAGGIAPDVAAGVYELSGPLEIDGLTLRPGRPENPSEFKIAFAASTPFKVHPLTLPSPPGGEGNSRPAGRDAGPTSPLFSFAGKWKFEADSALVLKTQAGGWSVAGVAALDEAEFSSRVSPLSKARGTPCRLKFEVARDADGSLKIPLAELSGGPQRIALSNLEWRSGLEGKIRKIELREGWLRGALDNLEYDYSSDWLRADLDVAGAIPATRLTGSASAGISITDVSNPGKLQYALSRLSATLAGGTGILPAGSGTKTERGQDARATAGAPVALSVSGEVSGSLGRLGSRNLQVGLKHQDSQHQFEIALDVSARRTGTPTPPGTVNTDAAGTGATTSSDAGATLPNLLDAFQAPGLPVLIIIPGSHAGKLVLHELATALGELRLAASGGEGVGEGGTGGVDIGGAGGDARATFDNLRLELAAEVEQFSWQPPGASGPLSGLKLKIPSLLLDKSALTVQGAKIKLFGDGDLEVQTFACNLKTGEHSGSYAFSNLNLRALTALAHQKDGWQTFGRLSGGGTLAGTAQSRSWNGAFDARLAGLVRQKEALEKPKAALEIGGLILDLIGAKPAGGLAEKVDWAATLYSGSFGLFLPRMEFEPFEGKMAIENGRAAIARTALAGKGSSAGLGLAVEGALDLPSGKFAPRFLVHVTALPPATQRVLKLDQLEESERREMLKEFEEGRFPPVVLTGEPWNLLGNALEDLKVARAFQLLYQRAGQRLEARKPAPSPPAQPPGNGGNRK